MVQFGVTQTPDPNLRWFDRCGQPGVDLGISEMGVEKWVQHHEEGDLVADLYKRGDAGQSQ